MDGCLDQYTLRRYVQGSCDAEEVKGIEAHLARCKACKRRAERQTCDSSDQAIPKSTPAPAGDRATTEQNTGNSGSVPTQSMPHPSDTATDGVAACTLPAAVLEVYQILEELPQGGQAVVYKAIHRPTRAKVALKFLMPSRAKSAAARRHFKQEVELAASLNHPNIVAIRDSGVTQGQYYFSMNYVHGQPLDRHVQSHTLSLQQKLELFAKICDAMKHAHQHCVIHRDLKPSNIVVDERGEPHILDFGLAKTAEGLSTGIDTDIIPTLTGDIKGTVAYMSPEQATGRPNVDVRTDVYSLGVILYQMCTGRFPYDVIGTIVEALQNIQYAEPVRPRQVISRFDSDVEAIILKCLAKDPDQRYQSAAELQQDAHRWLEGLPIVAKSISSIYLLRKIVARHRYTATVMTLVLVILCSSACISLHMYKEADKARTEAQKTADQASAMAQKQTAVAQSAARFIADLMMRDRQLTSEPSSLIRLYGPRRVNNASHEDRSARDRPPTGRLDAGSSYPRPLGNRE